MPSSSDPARLLADFSAACRELGCRWFVFGAQAVNVWGRPRMTTDVDVTLLPGSTPTTRLLAAAETHHFQRGIEFSDEFVQVTRVLPLRHVPTNMTLDVVLGGPGTEEVFADRSKLVDLSGVQVPMISPEDLVVSKALAGRHKDLEDIRGIIVAQRKTLDVEYIRRALEALEGALGQSDLMPVLDQALASVRSLKLDGDEEQ